MAIASPIPAGESAADKRKANLVLVVDDSPSQRRLVVTFLRRWGYRSIEAASGAAALDICRQQPVDLVISDWMMPGLDGLEFCKALRALPDRPYVYFVLLTSKSEKPDIAQGLHVGADDFLTKPVSSDELLARINAGERILAMERELREKNRLVSQTLAEISALYDALDQDLVQARQLQHSLLPERSRDFGRARVSLLLRSSGHVGGDFVSFLQTRPDELALFGLDVSGHGVASAMLTARIAGMLSSANPAQNVALEARPDGQTAMRPPADIAVDLNRMFFEDIQTEQYFTIMIGRARPSTGQVDLVQCGHPNAAVQDRSGKVTFRGVGGLPIGMFEQAEWEPFCLTVPPGGRLLIASDGMTECPTLGGGMVEEAGLARILSRLGGQCGEPMLEALMWELSDLSGDSDFPDDVSGLLFERH